MTTLVLNQLATEKGLNIKSKEELLDEKSFNILHLGSNTDYTWVDQIICNLVANLKQKDWLNRNVALYSQIHGNSVTVTAYIGPSNE
jgi:hypothetical protein